MTETAEQKLTRYEYVIDAQMTEIDRLRVEVDRLVSWIQGDLDSLTVLQSIYTDPSASQANRIKSAAAALPFEKPKLTSVAPPLELKAVEVIPLKEFAEIRRERSYRMLGWPIEPDAEILLPQPGNDSDGSD